ncbi:GNAT family N-acetyltransferase [Sphingopyxis flava]|uniref:Acetyltransferase (GNAT) family protein n=1 Tax=Sphingopyxis flava TaxID=1507287 RepID=A0A1T5A5D3_9SPHN|nr:GNAT family N-acetyltransferase [Sphingopyxis flava]SKB29843.1 Acetyltransferase (GNAT) family protein [Sphingopyxis flava]
MTGGWRSMGRADLDAVAAISDRVHGAFTEPRGVYCERLDLYPAGCRVLERGAAVAGYLITHPWHRGAAPKLGALLGALPVPADIYYLHDIALLPAARGTGAGSEAAAFVRQQARLAGCEEIRLVAVNGAETYWRSQGFEEIMPGQEAPYGPGSYLMRGSV